MHFIFHFENFIQYVAHPCQNQHHTSLFISFIHALNHLLWISGLFDILVTINETSANPEVSQTSKMKLFAKIFND